MPSSGPAWHPRQVRRAVDAVDEPGQFLLTGSAVPADDVERRTPFLDQGRQLSHGVQLLDRAGILRDTRLLPVDLHR
ncbi:MAG: hypothetical protein ACOYLI_02405 [Synechococcus lacustris]